MSPLQKALSIIDERSKNETERGTAFDNLAKIFFENDAIQTQQYSKVWHFSDWAKEQDKENVDDIGIDLVAELSDGSGFCSIQCKYYAADHPISKKDIDSWVSASSTSEFVRMVLVDSTSVSIGSKLSSEVHIRAL